MATALGTAIKSVLPAPAVRAIDALYWRYHIAHDWWGTKVWTRRTETLTPLGFTLASGFHSAYADMRQGTFEPHETAIIARQLRDADVFVDVGANLGYYTLIALKAGKRVVAVEPQPLNLSALYRNLVVNGWTDRAEVFPVALADKPGLLTLYGASGPSASLVAGWAGYSSRHRQTVAVSTLDTLLGERFAGERLLIKVDVEGAELGVLKGALATVAREPKPSWLLEVCLQEYHPSGRNPDFAAIFDLFFDHGYRAFAAIEPLRAVSREDILRWVESGSADAGTFNYLFTAA
jgi:FkbM family methyltransferase